MTGGCELGDQTSDGGVEVVAECVAVGPAAVIGEGLSQVGQHLCRRNRWQLHVGQRPRAQPVPRGPQSGGDRLQVAKLQPERQPAQQVLADGLIIEQAVQEVVPRTLGVLGA